MIRFSDIARRVLPQLRERLREIDLTISLKAVRDFEYVLEPGYVLGAITTKGILDRFTQLDKVIRWELEERVLSY